VVNFVLRPPYSYPDSQKVTCSVGSEVGPQVATKQGIPVLAESGNLCSIPIKIAKCLFGSQQNIREKLSVGKLSIFYGPFTAVA
jgi:hypothetical protein